MKKNQFQKFLTNKENFHIIKEVVKLYHPNLKETYVDKKGKEKSVWDSIKVYLKFDWVCISSDKIDIGIEFEVRKNGQIIMSGPKPLSDFENAFQTSKFRAWRFVSDSKYSKEYPAPNNPDVNHILEKYNCPRPTAIEMSKYYHSD